MQQPENRVKNVDFVFCYMAFQEEISSENNLILYNQNLNYNGELKRGQEFL